MSVRIYIDDDKVLLEYYPEMSGTKSILDKFKNNEKIGIIYNVFLVTKNDLFFDDDIKNENTNYEYEDLYKIFPDSITFIIGKLEKDYYKILKRILRTEYDVLIHNSNKISKKNFITNKSVSIFRRFESLANQQIIIGGNEANSIPNEVFKELIDKFPSQTEHKHYEESRVTNILSEYLEGVTDVGRIFEKYLEKRTEDLYKNRIIKQTTSIDYYKNYEYAKYEFVLNRLKGMLKDENSFKSCNESVWQKEIVEIILLLFPKYIKCFEKEVRIKDFFKDTYREIDLSLIDFNGNIDIIEIKKPFENCILPKKPYYRDNYTPLHELSGSVMQVEKYLFHLNKSGKAGEEKLNTDLKDKLPNNLSIKITNPKGFIIIGRDNNFNEMQKNDFEIIKRKYSNIMDIITYDDLIRRLESLIEKFKPENN